MGDPHRPKKKYAPPRHPWHKTRIDEERKIVREYGLGKKQEIYKANWLLKRYTDVAKQIIKSGEAKQGQKEAQEIVAKLKKQGLLNEEQGIEDILRLTASKFLDRRLQTLVFRKGLAITPNQARQLIVHGHVMIAEKKVDAPGHMVTREEEKQITYREHSPFRNDAHPERVKKTQKEKQQTPEIVQDVKPQEVKA